MKALILAAGLGSRLEHKTKTIPKALTKVKGKPILHYQLATLKDAGIKDIIIILGYKGAMIKNYANQNFPDLKITYLVNEKYRCSNSSYSFWQAKNLLQDGSYIHLNCDNLFSYDLLTNIINSSFENVIATRNDLVLTDKMVNVELEDSKMINMSVKFFKKASCKAFGISKFSIQSTILLTDKIKQYVERGELNKTYYSIIGQSLNTLPYHAFPTDSGHLLEINTLSDLEVAVKNWAHKIRKEPIASKKND